MQTNFLANLGTGLRNFGAFYSPEFETGARLGSGIRNRFRKRPGEPEDVETENFPSLPSSTPPFGSGESSKLPNVRSMMEDPVASAEDDARRNLPINLPGPDDPLGALIAEEMSAGRPGLPNLPPRSRMPVTVAPMAVPGGVNMPAPAFNPEPIRDYRGREISDRVGFERDQYVRKGMKSPEEGGGFKRSLGMTLRNAMLGASNALSRGGGIEGAIGGALAGAGGSLINPRAGYEVGFELGERPRIEAEKAREQKDQDRANMDIFNQAKLDDLRAETGERRARTQKLGEPTPPRSELRIGVDRVTGERRFYNPLDPKENARFEPFVAEPAKPRPERQPTAAELSVDPESGMSVEEMADASYKARGGDQYVFDRLPPRTRQILSAGTITTVDGKTINATQAERDAARKEFERAVGRQRKTDADYTRGHIRGKRVGATKGGKGAAQPSVYKRNINELPPLR